MIMKLNYSVTGEGQDIILLHGWGGSSKSLSSLQEKLTDKGFRVYNVDLPGFGLSQLPDGAMHLTDYVGLLAEFMTSLNIISPIIVGHSFGGKIALKTAILKPELISALVLIDVSGIKPKNQFKKKMLYGVSKPFKVLFSLPLIKYLYSPLRMVYYRFIVREKDYYKSGKLRETFINVVNEHLDGDLPKIVTNTLIIWGAEDKVTPLWMGKKINSEIATSRLEVVADIGHGLPLKQPAMVAEIIYNYFKIN